MTGADGSLAVLETLWQQQSRWSQAASRLKAGVTTARWWTFGLTIAGVVLGALSGSVSGLSTGAGRVLAAGAAAALAVAPLTGRGAAQRIVHDWTRARAVSETIKGEIYTYLAGAAPYRGADRLAVLQRTAAQLTSEADDIVRHTAGLAPKSRPLPQVSGIDSYLTVRVQQQIDGYYRPGAARFRARLRVLRGVEVTLTGLAAVIAAVLGVFPVAGLAGWIGVLTTVAAAIAAHGAAQRYDYQQIEYSRTADHLERLRLRFTTEPDRDAAFDRFVGDCERVISIQNEGWMVKVGTADGPDPGAAVAGVTAPPASADGR